MEPERFNWSVLVYDDTGRVLINTTIQNKTETEIENWRTEHENDSWASVNIGKQ